MPIPRLSLTVVIAFCMLIASLCSSCENINLTDVESSEETSGKTTSVRVITRAENGDDTLYPLHVYAFNAQGSLLAQQHLAKASDELLLSLPQNTECQLVAVSADASQYILPSTPTPNALIALKKPTLDGSATDFARNVAQGFVPSHPLQMGKATIFTTSANSTASVQLNYQMASLEVTISDLPTYCTNTYISVSSPFQYISLSGQGEGSQTSRIPLTRQADGTLTTGRVYLFPTIAGHTTFTIAYTDALSDHAASVNYLATLTPGTPYILHGSYDDGNIHLSGSFTSSAWNAPVTLDFAFDENSSITIGDQGEGDHGQGDEESVAVSAIPQSLSVWNGHVVLAALDDDGEPIGLGYTSSASLLLLSLSDWDAQTSATNTSSPTHAFDIAQSYAEADLTSGWRIPTTEEGKLISASYVEDPTFFDKLLDSADADPVVLTDQKGNNLRYLCEGAMKTYSFKNTTISNAGATVKTYHLRLVRSVRVHVPTR